MNEKKLDKPPVSKGHLLGQVGASDVLSLSPDSESAWIDVIHKMDDIYTDLVHYQVELEEKNLALEAAQQFIRDVLASITDVLIVCDLRGTIVQVNRALESVLDQTESELIQQSIYSLFNEDSQQLLQQFLQRLRSGVIVDSELNLQPRNAPTVPIATNCSAHLNSAGKLIGMVLIGRPIGELRRAYQDLSQAHGELKQAQQQLVQSEKMASLGRLVAGVAHELNNPISFVFGNVHAMRRYEERLLRYVQELENKLPAEEIAPLRQELKIDRILKDMGPLIDGTLEGAARVSDIVQELRRFSAGQKEQAELFNLSEVIKTAAHWVVRALKVQVKIHFELPSSLEIVARKGHVHQIMVNLIQNAVDVMEQTAEPVLEVSSEITANQVRIKVRDHGPGLAPDSIDKIFDPFFTTKPVGKGTGLGLYISYNLAADQGGLLQAVNHPGGGAEFILSLPLSSLTE